MGDTFRLLVTASRIYGAPDVIETAFAQVRAAHPRERIVLMHGKCDPRHPEKMDPAKPGEHLRIPWADAQMLPPAQQMRLLSGDWLADRIARTLGWGIEAFPAQWAKHGNAAGVIRNSRMAATRPPECSAFLASGRPNRGTLDCAGKALAAGSLVVFWCDQDSQGRPWPCRNHSLQAVIRAWDAKARRVRQQEATQGELPL